MCARGLGVNAAVLNLFGWQDIKLLSRNMLLCDMKILRYNLHAHLVLITLQTLDMQ